MATNPLICRRCGAQENDTGIRVSARGLCHDCAAAAMAEAYRTASEMALAWHAANEGKARGARGVRGAPRI